MKVRQQGANMADVARAAGVSVSAVSLVARGQPGVSDATRQRVLAAMDQLGYTQRSPSAHRGRKLFGLLIERLPLPVLSDLFYAEVIQGIQEEAQHLGYPIILQTYGNDMPEPDLLYEISRSEMAGLLIAAGGDISDRVVEQLAAFGRPIVLVETLVRDRAFPCILADNVQAGHLATEHLIRLGHRRIAALPGPTKYSSLVDRIRGYYAALGEAGLANRPEYVPSPKSGVREKGYQQMKELLALAEPPSAVFAVSDKSAFGALLAIRESGRRVPDDVAVVSVDNVIESAQCDPPLTTVHVPKRQIGILAARRLHELITRGEDIPTRTIVYSELVIRESCGARKLSRSPGDSSRATETAD